MKKISLQHSGTQYLLGNIDTLLDTKIRQLHSPGGSAMSSQKNRCITDHKKTGVVCGSSGIKDKIAVYGVCPCIVCPCNRVTPVQGASLIRNCLLLGTYSGPMLRVLGGWVFSYGRVTPVEILGRPWISAQAPGTYNRGTLPRRNCAPP